MSIDTLKALDKLILAEAGVKTVARVIGYNELGEPIELVYCLKSDSYEIHVGGDYVTDASQQLVEQCSFLQA